MGHGSGIEGDGEVVEGNSQRVGGVKRGRGYQGSQGGGEAKGWEEEQNNANISPGMIEKLWRALFRGFFRDNSRNNR